MSLHPDFKRASWRGVTNTDGLEIGVSFDLCDGTVVRLRLDVDCARECAEAILDYVGVEGVRMNSHSESSSGSPSVDVSEQRE